ncbi:MAG: Flp pilus assembly complex ATPase component TadA [Candidatus Omnitrophica bacterium]|nr:Flp pilus assembly complex ATPase component TadA [Candidatus Omnitrophota bacterium]MCM8826961.1 Flp pilus assembly complex ATPase component TadA [Candidatus Omnitrophota bacterium]
MHELSRDFTKLLVDKGVITKEQLEKFLDLYTKRGGSLSELLIELGYVEERDLMMFLSVYLSIPLIKVLNIKISKEILGLIPKDLARKYKVIPLSKIGNILTVATSDPLNVLVFEDLEKISGLQINPVIALRSELQQALDINYQESITTTIEEIIKSSGDSSIEIVKEEKEEIKDEDILRSIEEAPVVKLTNHIFRRAVEEKASDVLIELLKDHSRVRYRIDGVLREAYTFPKSMYNFVISRIKVIANLDITEHRLPQDGRFRLNIEGRDVDFRVSVLPSVLGEKIVLRVLDKSSALLDLDRLGFEEDLINQLKRDSLSSYGMILVCGPTGSGKTTTMYSILRYIYTPEKNIITVEDPIEYQLPGINQVNTNEEVGLTFASALRSILRQDPDVIMVGEIRDFETVDIAIKSALTGHLVLSTIHTTTASGSVTRLINMGVEPFLISSTIVGVLAQRLVRKLCEHCKEPYEVSQRVREELGIKKEAVIYKPKGCKLCYNSGYKGRIVLGEYLHLDTDIRRLINESSNEHIIRKEAKAKGMLTLREDGILKLEKGITSLEEVLRVTSAEER